MKARSVGATPVRDGPSIRIQLLNICTDGGNTSDRCQSGRHSEAARLSLVQSPLSRYGYGRARQSYASRTGSTTWPKGGKRRALRHHISRDDVPGPFYGVMEGSHVAQLYRD